MALVKRYKSLFLISVFLFLSIPVFAVCETRNDRNDGSSSIIRFEDNLLTVKVRDIPLQKVMTEIAHQTGIKIVLHGEAEELLSADFSAIPLEKGLRRLTRGINCVLLYGPEKIKAGEAEIREVIIYSKTGEGPSNPTAPSIIDPKKRNQEKLKETSPESPPKTLKDKATEVLDKTMDLPPVAQKAEGFVQDLGAVLLNHKDENVRASAAKTLGGLRDQMAIVPLVKALHDKEPLVRKSAVEALSQIGGEKVIPPLGEALKDKDEGVREAAAEALKE